MLLTKETEPGTISSTTFVQVLYARSSFKCIEVKYISMLSDVSCQRLLVALSMDEMKIKSGLVFNKNEGRLVGFTDLGRGNSDIEELLSNESESAEEQLADSVFVFMIRTIFKPSLSVAVAHYFTRNLKGIYTSRKESGQRD